MSAAIVNIAEAAESIVSIDAMNNAPSANLPSPDSHSRNDADNVDSNLNAETVDDSGENKEKKDVSFSDAAKSTFKRKFRNFLDSDSEEDNDNAIVLFSNKSYSDKASIGATEPSRKKKSRCLVGSDSDEDITVVEKNMDNDSGEEENTLEETAVTKPAKSRLRMIIDSDSDDNDDESKNLDTPKNNDENNTPDENEKKNKAKFITIIDSESEYENGSDHSSTAVKKKKQTSSRKKNTKTDKIKEKSSFNKLIDTDSEDDTERNNVEHSFNEERENGISEKKSGKMANKRTGSVRASKDEAMRQIHSETQRLIRSSAVSLPYHVPKQRSLQDFLNRRKCIPDLPEGLTNAAKVRMSSQIVGKVLEEKEKEAELFYKSSDSEDEEITPAPVSENPIDEISCSNVDEIVTEETQKIHEKDTINSEKPREIIDQDTMKIGVPRKLFIDVDNEEEKLGVNSRKNTIETEQSLVDDNTTKKLLNSDYDEGVDSPPKDNDSSILVINDLSISENRKDIGPELENIDEGIHSLSKINEISSSSDPDENDFILKLPDSELPEIENSPENDALASINMPKESAQSSNMSEISSKNREVPAVVSNIDEENDDDNSNEPAFGHVFGLPPPDMDEPDSATKISSNKKKLLPALSNVCPKLRGSPGMMIDLTNDERPHKEGVKTLVDRFMRHSAINKPSKQSNCPVTVLHTEKTPDGVRLIEETLPYKLPMDDSFVEKELQKPGAKYKRLRMDLIEKMAKKRGEEWKLKEQREKDEISEDIMDNEDDEDYNDEDEAEMKLADDEYHGDTESEPDEEEDYASFEKRKKRKPREFADDEAEVSGEDTEDNEDEDEKVMNVSDEEEEVENDDENISLRVDQDEDDDTDVNSLSDTEESKLTKTPRRSRIVKAFEDDSNSQQESSTFIDRTVERNRKLFERTKTDVDMFETENDKNDWSSDAETEFPPSQILPRDQADARSQICKTPLTAVNVLRFVSPITQLTALNSYNDSPKYSPASNDVSVANQRVSGFFNDKTPIGIKESPISCDNEKRCGFQKKLFEDPSGTVNDEDLMGLCSGKFTFGENDERISVEARVTTSSDKVTATQLLDLCSGTFSSEIIDFEKYEEKREINDEENSQDIRLALDDDSDVSCDNTTLKDTRKGDKNSCALKVDSSSDNENSNELANRGKKKISNKKRKVQKLDLSDDEDDEKLSNVELNEETRDKYVDYDSEENEIVVVPKRDVKKAARDFLEAEAELSEDEWASEDEDEKDLDRLEFEEGDAEDIDENQMRDQLGKLHMRQVQDDDQREVRMLQELLFEDGDLHTDGSGRERKFRWKNIDQLGGDDELGPRTNDDNENGDPIEEENDLEWRKERIEREKFIEDKMKLSTDEVIDELAVDSQVFKLGIKALKRINSSQNSRKEPEPAVTKPVVPLTVLDLVAKQTIGKNTRIIQRAVTRGSFLARGDECLARLAVHIKHSSEPTITTRKNTGKCVFTHISPSVAGTTEKNEKVETIEDSSANSKTKKRKSTAGVTPRSTKKAKVDATRSTGKKLF